MSFSLSGSTITQAGTDASLSGLSGVAGVTTRTIGAGAYVKVYYTLPNGTSLTYNNLTIDPRYECLVLGQTTSLITPSSSSSVLTIGSNLTQFGGTYGSQQEAIVSGNNSGFSYEVSSGLKIFQGTLNWYYGTIRVQTCTGLGAIDYNNGTLDSSLAGYIGSNAILEIMTTVAGDSCQVEFAGAAGLVVEGLKVRGYGSPIASGLLSITTGRVYTQAPSFQLEGLAGLSYQAGVAGAQPVLTSTAPAVRQSQFFTTYGFKSLAGPKGLNIWLGSLVRGINCPDGSAVKILEHNTITNHSQGYVEIRNEARFTQQNVTGIAAPGVITYMRDTNNGSRKLYNLCQQNIDNTGDKVYIATSDAGGVSQFMGNTGSVLLCAVAHLTASYVGSDNTGQNLKDLRGKTNVPGTDDFTFYHWGYGFIVRVNDVILKSTTTPFTLTNSLIADTGVTLSQSAAAALATISTLDDLYDAAKNWKCQALQANLEYPTPGTALISFNGTEIDLGGLNLVIDAAAGTAFSVNTGTGTVTIKSSVLSVGAKFLALTTTGLVSFANGATSSAPYTDSTGSSAQLNITCLAGSTVAVFDASLTQQDYQVSAGGAYSLNIAPGATGTWTWVADKAGYTPARGTFTPGSGGVTSVTASMPQKLNPDGTAMYQATTSSLVAVSFSGTTNAFIDIGDGTAPLQATFDEAEVALTTANGMKWLASGKADVNQFNSGSGDFLFLTTGWRLRRASAGDGNAAIQAFVQSTDGTPVDDTNGSVQFLSSDSPTAIAAAVRANLLDLLDVAVSTRATQVSADKAVANAALAAALSA